LITSTTISLKSTLWSWEVTTGMNLSILSGDTIRSWCLHTNKACFSS
jgi:hypothetical protein